MTVCIERCLKRPARKVRVARKIMGNKFIDLHNIFVVLFPVSPYACHGCGVAIWSKEVRNGNNDIDTIFLVIASHVLLQFA
jgi:hypothetical protein